MRKFLTKNLVLSILAGFLIMAGAFWFRSSSLANKTIATGAADDLLKSNLVVYQKDKISAGVAVKLAYLKDQTQEGGTIKVADLPSVNGSQPQLSDKLTLAESKAAPSGSTLAFDNIKDKSILYISGTKRYDSKDTKSLADTNRASLLAYGIGLTKIISGYPFYLDKSPIEITLDAYNQKGASDDDLTTLETIKLVYEERSKSLLRLAVPDELANIHLNLINSFDRASQLIKNMEQIGTDNLLALNSARQYVEESKVALNIFGQLNGYFKDKGIDVGEDNKINLAVDVIN